MRVTPLQLKRLGLLLLCSASLLLLLQAFVGDIYRIGSASMEPTLCTGERVLVLYDDSPPERFDLVALRRGDEALVKRVAGVPNETIAIEAGGDLLIDGERLAPEVPRPNPILVFDAERAPIAEYFRLGSSTVNPWQQVGQGYVLDAREIAPFENAGLMGLKNSLPADARGCGEAQAKNLEVLEAGDAIVEFELRPLAAGGRVVIVLEEQGDVFRFTIELVPQGAAEARLARYNCGDLKSEEILAQAAVALPLQSWTRLRASNRDNCLELCINARSLLAASYLANRLHPLDDGKRCRSFGERVKLGGEGAQLELRALRIWRDLQYFPADTPAGRRAQSLNSMEYYLLGDYSQQSSDSREWGPVQRDAIFGRPVLVVWPWHRMRLL